jgi:hypothetical protein
MCLLKIRLELAFNFCNFVEATAVLDACFFLLFYVLRVFTSFELQHGMLILLLQRITSMLRL